LQGEDHAADLLTLLRLIVAKGNSHGARSFLWWWYSYCSIAAEQRQRGKVPFTPLRMHLTPKRFLTPVFVV